MSIILKKSENETFMKTAIEKLNVNKTSGLIRGHFLYVRTTNEKHVLQKWESCLQQKWPSFQGILAVLRFIRGVFLQQLVSQN